MLVGNKDVLFIPGYNPQLLGLQLSSDPSGFCRDKGSLADTTLAQSSEASDGGEGWGDINIFRR